MAEECIKMFFMKTPPSNQFLCRAYLCQAQLNAPVSSKNPVSTAHSPIKGQLNKYLLTRKVWGLYFYLSPTPPPNFFQAPWNCPMEQSLILTWSLVFKPIVRNIVSMCIYKLKSYLICIWKLMYFLMFLYKVTPKNNGLINIQNISFHYTHMINCGLKIKHCHSTILCYIFNICFIQFCYM